MKFTLILCLCLLVAIMGAQKCQNYHPNDLMESGLYEIQHTGSTQRRHIYQTTITNYVIPTTRFETALAIRSFENYNPVNGLDYALSGGQQAYGKNLIISLFIDEDKSWKSIKISYFVTSAKQFIAGFHTANGYQSSNSARNPRNLIFTNGHFPDIKLNFQKKYSVAVFITGIRVQGTKFSAQIINTAVDVLQLKVVVQFEAISEAFIQFLQFSFIIYPTSHQNFIFNTPSSTYEMLGIQSIRGGGFNTTRFTICRQIGGISCKQFEIYEVGRCVCQEGYSKNQIGQCILTKKCSQNQQFDVLRNACFCIQNYKRGSDGKCTKIKCGPNSSYNAVFEECQCSPGYELKGEKCIFVKCPEKSVVNSQTGQCQCIQTNYYINQGLCQLCDSSKNFFLKNGQCLNCQANAFSNGKECLCKQGFYPNNNLCSACHDLCAQCNGPSESQCTVCKDSTKILSNGACVTSATTNQCSEGTFLNSQKKCQNCSASCLSCQNKSICLKCSPDSFPFEVKTNNEKSIICTHFCGDGSKNNGEECDDGNSRANDGCFQCQIEEGYNCDDSTPSVCLQIIKSEEISQQNNTSSNASNSQKDTGNTLLSPENSSIKT